MDILERLHNRFDSRIVFPDKLSRDAHAEIVRLRAELDAANSASNHRTAPPVEWWARRAYYAGRSAGAAARDLISDLGSNGCAPTLQRMLVDLLDDANRASHAHSETTETLREVVRDIPKH